LKLAFGEFKLAIDLHRPTFVALVTEIGELEQQLATTRNRASRSLWNLPQVLAGDSSGWAPDS